MPPVWRRRLRHLFTPANVLALLVLFAIFAGLAWLRSATPFDPFTAEGMQRLLADLGWRAPVAFVLAVAVAVVVSQIPGVPLAVAAGAAFGIGPATAYTVLGNFLGAMLAYALGRSLGRGIMRVLVGRVVMFRDPRGAKPLGWVIFATRAIPLFPFDAISYAAGVSAVPVRVYAPATLLGLIPSTLAFTTLGRSLKLGLSGSLVISAVASVGLVAAVWALRGRNPWGLRDAVTLEEGP